MELENFALTDHIYLTVEGSTFDLHNRYSFHHIEYDIFARRLVLSWENGQVFPPLTLGDVQYIKLVFDGVYFFRCRESMQNIPSIQESDYVMNSAEFVRWLPDMPGRPHINLH